jgi:hypothetical protein
MSIKPLNERLDELSSAEKAVDETVPANARLDELIPLTSETPQFEPIQVAGLFQKGVGSIIKSAKESKIKTERPILPENVDQAKIGEFQVIRETGAKGEVIVQTAPQMPVTGKPSPTSAEVAAGVPETAFNLDLIADDDGVKQFIEATARAYGADKIEKISYKQMAEKLSTEGYDEGFIARIIDPLEATKASPQDAYKMQLALIDSGKRAFDLAEQVKAAKIAGNLDPELSSAFMQAVALHGSLATAIKGRQADIARTLGIFSQARSASVVRGEALEKIMFEAGGIESVHDFANKYTAISSATHRANMAASGYANTLKGAGDRLVDITMTTFINGILSLPVTHAKNIAANTFFLGLQFPELALASAIGKTRNFMFKGGEEAITGTEIHARAIGALHGLRAAGTIASKAFKLNAPTDPFTKIESHRFGRDPFEVDLGDSKTAQGLSSALEYYGKFVTLPGRALMAEDEFFKAIGYEFELNGLAARESIKMYRSLVKSGVDHNNAQIQAGNFMAELLENPTEEIQAAAMAAARTLTFTRDLEPFLQPIQRFVQTPLLKMYFPFVKTPTNTLLEGLARSPAFLASPRFYADFNAGGIRRDMSIARATLGSALIYSVGAGVFEGTLTGYGPYRIEDKKGLEGLGWQQFSFKFKKENVSPELLEKFQKLSLVSVGPEFVYISYAGLDPVAMLLAIGATAGEYAQMTPGGDQMDKLMMGGTLAIYGYLSESPMLKGFNDLAKVFQSGSNDGPTMLYDFMVAATKQAVSFGIGGSPLGVHQSFVAGIERVMDPSKSNIKPPKMSMKEGPLSAAERGYFEAVQNFRSRNPLTSDSLLRSLDPITGEVETQGEGKLYEMFNPFKLSSGKYNQAKGVLHAYGIPMYIPPNSINGIQLSDKQYNRWIELATQDGKLAEQISYLGESDSIQNLASDNLGKAQDIIQKTISDAYSTAKKILINEDPELFDAMREVEEYKRDYGKYKR